MSPIQAQTKYQGTPQNWSDPASWGGTVPSEYQDVTIPPGRTIVLNVPRINVGKLTIQGDLVFGDNNVEVIASGIIVMNGGLFEIGTSAKPYTRRAVITLRRGTPSEMGEKCLGAMRGGRIEIHGSSRDKVSWTQIAKTAYAGASSIELARPVNWESGDRIVIATTSMNPEANDVVTINSVAGKLVTFSPPLKFDHFGRVLRYGGMDVDMRAEVGLLSRNILIQGDELSESDKCGGHLMAMHESMMRPGVNYSELILPPPGPRRSTLRVEGAEFYRMGQKGRAGRYAVHWHLMGDAPGDYARNNSIHNSFHRALNIHGTSHVLLENNVCYNIKSHGIVPSEEGDEFFNICRSNLVVQVYAVASQDQAFPTDRSLGLLGHGQGEGRASGFWMRSPLQTFHGNRVAGVMQGMGFFFENLEWSDKQARDRSITGELTDFVGNVAHSILQPIEFDSVYVSRASGFGLFASNIRARESGLLPIRKFTCYKAQAGGAWIENKAVLEDSIIADCHTAIYPVQQPVLRNVVIVGQTENNLGDAGTINVLHSFDHGKRLPVTLTFKHPQTHRGAIHRNPRQANLISLTMDKVTFINVPVAIFHEGKEFAVRSSNLRFKNVLSKVVSTASGLTWTDLDGTLNASIEGVSAKHRPVYEGSQRKLDGFEWVPSQIEPSETPSGTTTGGSAGGGSTTGTTSSGGTTSGTSGTASSGGSTAGSTAAGSSSAGSSTGGSFVLKVNFQDATSPGVPGYLKDQGDVFGVRTGQGVQFGWGADNRANARNRNVHADERFDTLNHFQKSRNAVWEAAVPNGDYTVRIIAGDPSYTDQVNHLEVEGVTVSDPDGKDNFDEMSVNVRVTDGRLTVKVSTLARNAKICSLEIERR